MNLLWTSHDLPMNFIGTSYEPPMNLLWTSYELPTNFLQTSYKLSINFLWASDKFLNGFLQTSYDHFVCITYTQNKYPPVTLSSPQTTTYHFHPTLIFSYKARAYSSWAPYGTNYTTTTTPKCKTRVEVTNSGHLSGYLILGLKSFVVQAQYIFCSQV